MDDLSNMPSEIIAELKHVLKKESSAYGDNACKAFMLAMVSMIGGYRKALKFREVSYAVTTTSVPGLSLLYKANCMYRM